MSDDFHDRMIRLGRAFEQMGGAMVVAIAGLTGLAGVVQAALRANREAGYRLMAAEHDSTPRRPNPEESDG